MNGVKTRIVIKRMLAIYLHYYTDDEHMYKYII